MHLYQILGKWNKMVHNYFETKIFKVCLSGNETVDSLRHNLFRTNPQNKLFLQISDLKNVTNQIIEMFSSSSFLHTLYMIWT